jgi:hypothetical protein
MIGVDVQNPGKNPTAAPWAFGFAVDMNDVLR